MQHYTYKVKTISGNLKAKINTVVLGAIYTLWINHVGTERSVN